MSSCVSGSNDQPILDANGKTQLALNEKGQVQFNPDAAGVKSLDEFLQTKEGQKLAGATGGIQGVKGTLFGVPYEAALLHKSNLKTQVHL